MLREVHFYSFSIASVSDNAVLRANVNYVISSNTKKKKKNKTDKISKYFHSIALFNTDILKKKNSVAV